MFHGPVEEVWQGLHTQINLSGAAKRGAQRREVKPLRVPTKEYRVKQRAQGLRRGTCWALPCHSSKHWVRGAPRALPPAARLCNLPSSSPAASDASSQEEKPMGAQCPHGRIWSQVTRPCEIAGRRKAEEEKGDYSISSLLRWAPALCWLPALRKWHRCLAGALAMVQPVLHIQPSTSTSAIPRKTRESSGPEHAGKEDDPATNTPVTMPIPRCASGFCWRRSSITAMHNLPACTDPSLLQQGQTKVQVLLKIIYRVHILYKTLKAVNMYIYSAVIWMTATASLKSNMQRHFHICSCSKFMHLYKFLWGQVIICFSEGTVLFGVHFLKNKKKQDWQGKILAEVQSERHEIKNTWNRTVKRGKIMQKIQVYKLTAQNCLSKLLLEKRHLGLTIHLLKHIHSKCGKNAVEDHATYSEITKYLNKLYIEKQWNTGTKQKC